MKKEIKSIFKVISSNIFIMGIGIIQTIFLPIILGPEEYGYWAFYLLCIGYACFIMFGLCDGFYLVHGGTDYDEIDKRHFSSLHSILILYLLIILFIWTSGILLFNNNVVEKNILLLIGLSGILTCDVSFYVLLNQSTARFSIYSKGNIIEKSILLIATLLCIIFKSSNAVYVILASVIGKILTIIYYSIYSLDILRLKPQLNSEQMKNVLKYTKVGFSLALSSVCAGLITGIGRFIVKNNLGVKELGYYSLAFSITALLTQIIAAIAIVFFPLFRKVNSQLTILLLSNMDKLISGFSLLILIFYYPSYLLLQIIFPAYSESLGCILYMIPILICQTRISIVHNTLYKVFRMEKQLVFNSIITVIVCFILSKIAFFIIPTKETVMFITYIVYIFWNIISSIVLIRKINIKMSIISNDMISCILFILTNWLLGFSWFSFFISLIISFIIIYIKKDQLIYSFKKIKETVFDS